MNRLSNATLATLPAAVAPPRYNRSTVTPGIVHLGIGAFHRAHQAVMTDAILSHDPHWGIVAASLRSPDTRDALGPQEGLYTLAVRGADGEHLQVVGAISDVLVAPENPERLIAIMAGQNIRIVSLTVTEKGYCHDPANGEINLAHPDIRHDLAHPLAPRSAIGFILRALQRRREAGVPPFTVLCCDNLPANGQTVKRVLKGFAAAVDPALATYIQEVVACPSTMVDRIVPATTDSDRARVSAALGVADAWPVIAEPFLQWVIEDNFPTGRPAWENAGAEFVADVAPHELMKLRMLNGAHSALAYLGPLAGHVHVADAASDPIFECYLRGLWAEISPSLPAGSGLDPAAYAARLLERFRNPALNHRLSQIAMDGSQKLPQRHLRTIEENLAAGRPVSHLGLAVTAFLVHASGTDLDGRPVQVKDPMERLLAESLTQLSTEPAKALANTLSIKAIFGEQLPRSRAFSTSLLDAYKRLGANGAVGAVAALQLSEI